MDTESTITIDTQSVQSDNLQNPVISPSPQDTGETTKTASPVVVEVTAEQAEDQICDACKPAAGKTINVDNFGKCVVCTKRVKFERPKQENYPTLNAGGQSFENNCLADLWKTPQEIRKACEEYCNYLRQGRDKKYYKHDYKKVIENHYMVKHADVFQPDLVEEATRVGLANLEARVHNASIGKIPGANALLLMFIAKNKLFWKDRHDVTSDDKPVENTPHITLDVASKIQDKT